MSDESILRLIINSLPEKKIISYKSRTGRKEEVKKDLKILIFFKIFDRRIKVDEDKLHQS